jgi:hypothetical protein
MLRRTRLAPLLTAVLAALCVAGAASAHPGHGGIPHPLHHVPLLAGVLAAASLAAGLTWRSGLRRGAAPVLHTLSAAAAAAGAWLLLA